MNTEQTIVWAETKDALKLKKSLRNTQESDETLANRECNFTVITEQYSYI